MNFGTMIAIVILTWYTNHIIRMLFSKRNRTAMQTTNKTLEDMREKKFKTLEEQKNFVNLKFPKMMGWKFSWKGFFKGLPKVLLSIIFFILVLRGYWFLFLHWGIELNFWQGLLFMILFPLGINFVLEKFNIQKGDISVFFR